MGTVSKSKYLKEAQRRQGFYSVGEYIKSKFHKSFDPENVIPLHRRLVIEQIHEFAPELNKGNVVKYVVGWCDTTAHLEAILVPGAKIHDVWGASVGNVGGKAREFAKNRIEQKQTESEP